MKYNSASIFMFLFLSYLICNSNLLQLKKQNAFDPYISNTSVSQANNIQVSANVGDFKSDATENKNGKLDIIPIKTEESKILKNEKELDDDEDVDEVDEEGKSETDHSKVDVSKNIEVPYNETIVSKENQPTSKIEEINESRVKNVHEEREVDHITANSVVNEINTIIKLDDNFERSEYVDNEEEVSESKKPSEKVKEESTQKTETEFSEEKEPSNVVTEVDINHKKEAKVIEVESKNEENKVLVEEKEEFEEKDNKEVLDLPLDQNKVENKEAKIQSENKSTDKSEEIQELPKSKPFLTEEGNENSVNTKSDINKESDQDERGEVRYGELNGKPEIRTNVENTGSKVNVEEKKVSENEKVQGEEVIENKGIVIEKESIVASIELKEPKDKGKEEELKNTETQSNSEKKQKINEKQVKQMEKVQEEAKVKAVIENTDSEIQSESKAETHDITAQKESSSQSFLQKGTEKSGNLRKTIEKVGLETNNMDYDRKMLKSHDFQEVTYVASISPVGKASLNDSTQPEYEVLINDGYETPRVFRTMYDQHTTSVILDRKNKSLEVIKIPRDKELWGNVKAILNPK